MPSVHFIFKDIKALTDRQIEELFHSIGEIISVRTIKLPSKKTVTY